MNILIAGAGPAGLTAADELCRLGFRPVVVEAADHVGGLSATHEYKGYRFDIGGHRFFSSSELVNRRWREWLGDELLVRPRLSRIYFRGKYFHYPLRPFETLARLGALESTRIAASYAWSRVRPRDPEVSFEDWVRNRFGSRLFELFFRTYTEKVWGMPCSRIGADWAAQRIQNLNLPRAVLDGIRRGSRSEEPALAKTLVRSFLYPRLGPGQLWDAVADRIVDAGATLRQGTTLDKVHVDDDRVVAVDVSTPAGAETLEVDALISSVPLGELVRKLAPDVGEEALACADALRHRDFLTVGLVLSGSNPFPDQWLYIHANNVKVGRIQNYGNWSADMCPQANRAVLGFEYFVNRGDDLWNLPDQALIDLAEREGRELGLVDGCEIIDGTVIRAPRAYPVYDADYRTNVDVIRKQLSRYPNLWTVGRNGLHRYNNQDHSMLSGIFAAQNAVLERGHDVWEVNTDTRYHEEGVHQQNTADRLVPVPLRD